MLHFEIILDLPRKKKLQKNTQNFHIPFGELTHILTSHINHSTVIKPRKLILIQYY